MAKEKNKKNIFSIIIILLILFFLPFLFKKQEIKMDMGKLEKKILDCLPMAKLISETKSEFSYQVSYLNQGNSDYSQVIFKELKKIFLNSGWRIKQKELKEDYRLISFQPRKKEKRELLNVAISYQNNQGTFFGIDYHW